MDLMKTVYEFLDLSDVKGTELSSLQYALHDYGGSELNGSWAEPTLDPSSCSSSAAGPSTVSSSVDSVSGECEMAPHSPARAAAAPPPYAPPPYAPPPAQWPVAPPNVYVSQVTANVNVHGYMGQYYQPQPQYPPQTAERAPRPHRRERRGKRPPSPPQQQPPPYYVQYPHYYPPAQAQGAPLYHLPMYQPLVYGPYAYPPYYQDYPLPVEGAEGDKGPEEYPPEMVMEQEAVDAYYAGAHYAGPPYGPPIEGMEYMPPMYLPPPTHPPPMQVQVPPPHHHQPHQFNVYAKNFVHNPNKTYIPPDKSHEQKTPPATVSAAISVETLPIKDLKISKEPSSPKQTPTVSAEIKPASPSDKVAPVTKVEAPKPAWSTTETKPTEPTPSVSSQPLKTFPATVSANQTVGTSKTAPQLPKISKGPAAPFSGSKQPPKPLLPPTAVPVQQTTSAPKAPFANRQKREGPVNRSPDSLEAEKVAPPVEHKREPLLPLSKAPMPISITLHSQGPPVLVSNKPPFGHSRKSAAPVPEPVPAPQPPPPAPTASDFPPPPTPRNRGEVPPPVVQPQPQPAQGKSWASLFNKSTSLTLSTPSVPQPVPVPIEEPPSPTNVSPPAPKPVAKVPPFDASPSQVPVEKAPLVVPRVTIVATTPTISYSDKAVSYSEKAVSYSEKAISYSEKTSVNAVSNTVPAKPASPSQPVAPEVKEVPPPAKEPTPSLPVAPSPFADDPNSYRMGEFLSKYQLDHRAVPLMPRGLTNRSNYCYVNAILQALIACPPFYNMLKALPYQTRRGKSSTPVIDAMVELCYEFTLLPPNARVSRARGSEGSVGALPIQTGPPLDPSAGQKVLRALRPFPGSQEGRQEDAEEFLSCLLNGLNDEMLELMKLVEPEDTKETVSTEQEPPAEEDEDDDEWKVMGPKNRGAVERRWAAGRTPLADMFRGRTRVRLHRAPSRDVSDAVQPFFTLQLDIERASSVKEALEQVAGRDTLEGLGSGEAWQQLSLEQLPAVLLLHLKCFQLDGAGRPAKIVKNIDLALDLKIDPKIMSSKQKMAPKQRLYKLFAVVYHEGVEAVKGHYVTDTYHGQAGWIRYDDSTVTLVSDAQVLKPKPPRMPYLLMYRRQDLLPTPHRPGQKTE